MCGVKNVKGALTGSFTVNTMNGLVSLDGAEGIASVVVSSSGSSIYLLDNPILTSAIALANTEYLAGTLASTGNTILECVPSTWPATDKGGRAIPHGSCPTTPAPTPAPGSIGSTGGDMTIMIAVIAALACAAGFVYYRRRASAAHKKGDPLQKSLLGADELEMGSLGPNVPHTSQPDIPHAAPPIARTQAEKDACVARWSEGADSVHGHSFNDGELQVDFNDIQLDDANIIGDGGSCIVYKASVYGKICAVKALAVNASEWDEQQFDSEVKLLSTVQHANLCRYYACSTNGPQKCLLLEIIDTSLDKRLVAQPALGWQQCVHIALCICRGLSYLHSLAPPIIHRDIKSQNVLLNGFTTDVLDEVSAAKVADFGTVRASQMRIRVGTTDGKLKTDGKDHATTRQVVGTGPYMPQEYAGFGHVSAKTDAFAMGIVIIELLISGSMATADPEDFPFEARQLVDSKDAADLSAAIEAMAADGGWTDGSALRAAKVLTSVAVSCTRRTEKRQTPAVVLGQMEEAYELVDSDSL
jgi:hypothetical protein